MAKVSVIIPNHNSAPLLRLCLTALRAAESADMPLHEVIVVDDASTDDGASVAVAREFGAIIYELEKNVGPACARNHGVQHATGEILWFLDADVEVVPEAVNLVVPYFDDHPEASAVIGSYDDDPSDPNAVSQFKNLFHHFVHQNAGGAVSSFWSGCGVVRAEVFREIGGFDEAYWDRPSVEDIHVGYLLGRHGHEIGVLKPLQVKHHKRWTLIGLVKTDVFDRAIPWTAMLLHNRGQGSSELNLGWTYRASVIAVYLAILAVPAGFFAPWIWAAIPFCLAVPVRLNSKLVGFFKSRRGWVFLISAIPLLWLYFFYCGVGLILGIGLYVYEKWTGRHAFTQDAARGGAAR